MQRTWKKHPAEKLPTPLKTSTKYLPNDRDQDPEYATGPPKWAAGTVFGRWDPYDPVDQLKIRSDPE